MCGNSHESFEIVKHRLSQTFGQHFEQDRHSLRMADHFALHCEHLLAHLWTFYTIVLQFLHSLHSDRKPQLGILSVAGHIINHSVGEEQTIGDQLSDGLQGSELCHATSYSRAIPHSEISSQK
jgi:hypothetical protein